jgi:hypothetical protein
VRLKKITPQYPAATVSVGILAKQPLLRSVFTYLTFVGLVLRAKREAAERGSRRLANHSVDMAQKRALMFHQQRRQ